MRWNPNKAADLLSSGRTVVSDWAARTVPRGVRQTVSPARSSSTSHVLLAKPDDDVEPIVEDWLRTARHSILCTHPAIPDDFTARVMARIETTSSVAPRPIPITHAQSRPQPPATLFGRLCVAGGMLGAALLFVALAGLVTVMVAPNIALTLLNAVVGALISVWLLLGPLIDALDALASNQTLMLAIVMLLVGIFALCSRIFRPVRLAGEA